MNHRRHRLRWILPIILIILFAAPAWAAAHPLGNFTINRYARLTLTPQEIQLYYIVDMAEIPAFQVRPDIDADGDGLLSAVERERYLSNRLGALKNNLRLSAAGQPLNLVLREQTLEVSPGQGGLETLRLSAHFVAALPQNQTAWPVEYEDANYPGRLGWQEVVVKPTAGINLLESTAPTEDISQALRTYPEDLLQTPLTVNSARFRFEAGQAPEPSAASLAASPNIAAPDRLPGGDDFAQLIAIPTPGPTALFVALLAAFGWGAAHALTPGHGKTIVAAYLVGSRGTIRHAVFLGLTTTLTHTAGVFALGLLTLFASQFILPEQLYPWLGVISGLLVVGIGLSILRGRIAGLRGRQDSQAHHHHHDHTPDHPHPHRHHPGHPDDHSHPRRRHHHDHSHFPEGPVNWRSLLALGVSGGLIPCPSALVVMLSAIALQRIGFGVLLVVAFSLGLAGVLTIIGVLWVQAAQLLERISQQGRLAARLSSGRRWLQFLPATSALFITLVGAGVTFQALLQTGLLRL